MANQQVISWSDANPTLHQRGIDESMWNALLSSVFPGANLNSVIMAVDYCRARKLDILMKPVHIVPMSVKNPSNNQYEMRDVIMPGVGLYRIQAERTGNYAGADAPEFGDLITQEFAGKDNVKITISFPEWCKVTVYKLLPNGDKAAYSVIEYWLENYATQSRYVEAPNAMWAKRPRGQLVKCAEAQVLRRAWPEIGQEATAEEMQGKEYISDQPVSTNQTTEKVINILPDEQFNKNFPAWEKAILEGRKTTEELIEYVSGKGTVLSDDQLQKINNIGV
jgi:phage recombination protein Bet